MVWWGAVMAYTLHCGDCLEILPTLPDVSVDCVISDPPYPMIKRDYGMMTEAAWMDMMQEVVRQTRRILKPTGSAVFILQPNSERVGKMRLWLWKVMVWAGEEWGIVQDAYWWNYIAQPTKHTNRTVGLMRPSIKPSAWLGDADCYRNQDAVLWTESDGNKALRQSERIRYTPRGGIMNEARCSAAAVERGGVTPFNLLPVGVTSHDSAGAHGHGAGTPLKLADWWTRYICPPGGVVADWFTGSGTMGLAALQNGCSFVGIEKMPKYYEVARQRLDTEAAKHTQMELA
jgi:DNA modification methylase